MLQISNALIVAVEVKLAWHFGQICEFWWVMFLNKSS